MAKGKFPGREFRVPANSPLEVEHEKVKRWVEDALAKLGEWHYYDELDLDQLASGRVLLKGEPEQLRRCLMAAVEQVVYWDRKVIRIREKTEDHTEHPRWPAVWGRRRQAQNVIMALMKRSLLLRREDLLQILEWVELDESNSTPVLAPLVNIVRALERFEKKHEFDPELIKAARKFARTLRSCREKRVRVLGTSVEQLCVQRAG